MNAVFILSEEFYDSFTYHLGLSLFLTSVFLNGRQFSK